MRIEIRTLALFSLCALAASPARAIRPFTPEELLQTHRLGDVQLSPDGNWVSFTVHQKSLGENRDLKDIWLQAVAGGAARQLTRDGKSERARWNASGNAILVTSSRGGTPQLWLYDIATGGDPRQITDLSGGADGAIFSPDGRWIAFVSDVYPQCNGDDACDRRIEAERAASKVAAHISDHLFVRRWTEWRDGKRTHVFVLPAPAAGTTPSPAAIARDITPGDSDWPPFYLDGADDYAFESNGDALIVAHKAPQTEAWSTNADLFRVPVGGGAPKNLTEGNLGADRVPRVSPDGKWVAYLSQERDGYESDQWKLKLLELHTGKSRVIADFDDDVGPFAWRRDSKGLVASKLVNGRYYLENVSIEDDAARAGKHGRPTPPTSSFSPEPAGDDFTLLRDGSVAFIDSGMNRPPELARIARGEKARQLTSFNTEQYAGLDLGPAPEDLTTKAKDGTALHAWVLRPPALATGAKAPLIVLVHGGPQGAWEDGWGMRWNPAAFAARGYVVLMPNPRGSTGYGHKFEEEIRDQWGGLPYDDIQRLVDAAEQLPYVEAGRACAAGASYGGYMVDWIAGHTDRYRCLVSHDGVFDLRSHYGATEELWFPEFEFLGAYWENPTSYQRWSPSSYVQNFKTPTLVVQGELDFRVPTEQGMGMFTALQRRGVESRLLWFPDEGHWVLKPRNSLLWYRTVLDWIDAHLRDSTARHAAAPHEIAAPVK